jgi:Cu2+-exporting ATPase
MSQTCFHCGQPVPPGVDFPIQDRDTQHAACCAGCQAVAQTILDSGLGDYYRHRTAEARQADPLPDELLARLRLYDTPALQASFVRDEGGDVREAALMLEGITCAACVWLNERHLRGLPGVLSVDINYTSHRARVRWDNSRIALSAILESIAAIGYQAHPYDAERQEKLAQQERKQAINRLWVAGLSMMQVMMYAVPIYLAPDGEIDPQWLWLLHWASFILTLPVVVYSAVPFYRATWRDLKSRRVGMDTPVTIGILTAFFASLWALLNHIDHGVYFDSVSMFVFLLLGGRYLEGIARRKAGAAAESLVKLTPAFCHRLPDWPASQDSEEAVAALLNVGDVVRVHAGESFPADGEVLAGHSSVNESLLTGESRPLPRAPGGVVIAGSINLDSPLTVRVSQVGPNTRLAGVVRLLDQALAEKPRLAKLADRFAGWFVAVLLLAAAASYLGWLAIAPDRALWIMVAVLVVSCPCALSLATPAALTAATGHLAGIGMLTTRGHALETLAKVSDAVFDKTGTLTHGDMRLLQTLPLGALPEAEALALARSMEAHAHHPIARAFAAAEHANTPAPALDEVSYQAGCGLQAQVAGHTWRLGKPDYVAALAGPLPAALAGWRDDATVVALGSAHGWAAAFAIGDALRDDAGALIASLRRHGVRCHILSGDAPGAVAAVAAKLGVDSAEGGLLPEDKLARVAAWQAAGRRVLMLGDGVNDAPVLARADVSVAMGGGADVARMSGDMVLVNDQLQRLDDAVLLARRTLSVIRQNLWWAAGYNLVALPLAISGHLTPWLASLGMACSSLLVVSNALRLVRRG